MLSSPLGFNVIVVTLSIVRASGFLGTPSASPGPKTSCHGFAHATTVSNLGVGIDDQETSELSALEFYSGIGGLRVSLDVAVDAAGLRSSDGGAGVVESYDINSVANRVYEHNFPGPSVTRRSIEHLTGQDLDGVADIWLLSPPCQPFCRVGKQMDTEDPRSVSFMHLLSILAEADDPPLHFFLENVQGFEGSRAHERLLEVLGSQGYAVEQYLLSPVQLGIPNTRLRYYCLATRRNVNGEDSIATVETTVPLAATTTSSAQDKGLPVRTLSEYLDTSLEGDAAIPLLLSAKAASHANPSLRFDVVTSLSTETTTFTKGYGKHAGRAGPVILLSADGCRRASQEDLGRFPEGLNLGPNGRELRWFSDREMLRIHGFPENFGFPPDLTLRQRFGLVGNSVNVEVVALLLRRLLFRVSGVESGVITQETCAVA